MKTLELVITIVQVLCGLIVIAVVLFQSGKWVGAVFLLLTLALLIL